MKAYQTLWIDGVYFLLHAQFCFYGRQIANVLD